MKVVDSVFLITGCSSGFGEATSIYLLDNGANIVGCDIQSPKDDVFTKYGNKFVFLKADVTSEKDITEVLSLTKEKFGKLDGIINNAGIGNYMTIYDFETNTPISLEKFNKVIQVNLVGNINVSRLSIGLLKENQPDQDGERGIIINTGSITGMDGPVLDPAYVASKAAIHGLTLSLARDLSEYGIRVVTIAPGFFNTPIIKPAVRDQDPAVFFKHLLVHPKRIGEPEEFASMVKVVVENVMLNGVTIRLDGGQRLGFNRPRK